MVIQRPTSPPQRDEATNGRTTEFTATARFCSRLTRVFFRQDLPRSSPPG
jgi:hypothetical protein